MVSEVSKGQKSRVNPFRTLEVQEMEYTYSSKNLRNYEKKWGLLENKIRHKFVLCWRSEINVSETWSFSLPGTWWKVSTKEVDLHWRKVCSTNSMFIKSINIQRSFIRVITQQMSTEICTKLFSRRRIKRQDRRRSFSISLNFYQTILESSLQTRFMLDIKKLLLMML